MSRSNKRPVYSREFKLAAVRRMEAGESPTLLAEELKVPRQQLSAWRSVVRKRGEEALRGRYGRPNKSELLALSVTFEEAAEARNLVEAKKRIAQLEAKVGQQAEITVSGTEPIELAQLLGRRHSVGLADQD